MEPEDPTIVVIGAGRMGTALVTALTAAGATVLGPAGRGSTGAGADIVLLAVPDAQIADAAAQVTPGPWVGHLSGATTLTSLAPHPGFSIHPLMSVTADTTSFTGAPAAIAGATPAARATAAELAGLLGMRSFTVSDADRVAYHAAASMASNFLVTLEGLAEELAASAGVPRDALVPLVRSAVQNWGRDGAARALTGPIVRGDHEVVARQRAAVVDRLPKAVPVFDALTAATIELARTRAHQQEDHA